MSEEHKADCDLIDEWLEAHERLKESFSLRDYFAAHALVSEYIGDSADPLDIASRAYEVADAMIYHREHNEPEV